MRILHTADWHFGRTLHGVDLTDAFNAWCDHVVDVVSSERVDAVLVSGDIYDRGVPPVTMVDLLSDVLERLLENAQVVLTSGNHDSAKRLGFAAPLLRSGLTIRTDSTFSGKPILVRNDDGGIGALVYALPYLDPDIERHRLAPEAEDAEPLERSHEAVIRAALGLVAEDVANGAHARVDVPRIAMAHAFITGGEPSESERDIHIGGVDSAPADLFRLGTEGSRPLDYVALGHLHGPQKVGSDADPVMRYSGSPIAFSFSEQHHKKSSVLLDFSGGGQVTTKLIPAPVLRPLATIKGTLKELLSPAFAQYRNHYLRVQVTDPERPARLKAQLDLAFNHVLEVQHITEKTAARRSQLVAQKVNPLKVLEEFFVTSGGRELTGVERELIEQHWHVEKAG